MYPVSVAYHIDRLPGESAQRYSHRHWFVAKQNPRTRTEFRQAIKWSIIDTSITYDKCKYNSEVTDLVERMKVGRYRFPKKNKKD